MSKKCLCLCVYIFMIYYLFLRGNFTNWLDGKPLTATKWVHPNETMPMQTEILIIEKGRVKNVTTVVSETTKQPVFSLRRNCTVGHFENPWYYLRWSVIPCNESFVATFVCQKQKPISYKPSSWSLNPLIGRVTRAGFFWEVL